MDSDQMLECNEGTYHTKWPCTPGLFIWEGDNATILLCANRWFGEWLIHGRSKSTMLLFSLWFSNLFRSASFCGQLAGRIPLAYAHFVQILVDSFLVLAPFALYVELGIWSIPAVGLLTLFYSGLLDLAKILLDPLENDGYYNSKINMDIGVLIRESNASSSQFTYAAEKLPFSTMFWDNR